MKKLYAFAVVIVITILSWVSMFSASTSASSSSYGRGSSYYGGGYSGGGHK